MVRFPENHLWELYEEYFDRNVRGFTDPVVLNRGAAELLGAAESSRGAANFWIWLVFTSKMQLGVTPNC